MKLQRSVFRITPVLASSGALLVALAITGAAPALLHAQAGGLQRSGPIITSAGQNFAVENPTFDVPAGHVFKVLFEVNRADTTGIADQLNTMARFYNIHGRHGIAVDRLQGAAVFHGSGWTALLSDAAYAARFNGKTNPNGALVAELLKNGARLVLCGQTAGARGIKREELLPGVQVAVSAMTAFNVLEAQGYRFNPW